ncbi:MAG: DUF1156 domain-containing protein, partial [Candidatus Odinarchaeota archaeon]
MEKFGDLFNSRQKLVLITFSENIRRLYNLLLKEDYEKDYAKAIIAYLAMNFDKMLNKVNTLARWNNIGEKTEYIFDRQAIAMLWDYSEVNPLSNGAGSWESYFKYTLKALENLTNMDFPIKNYKDLKLPVITQSSATNLSYQDEFFDAVFTDPPYYDNVFYSNLSDFFYVWLKRILGHLYPNLFSTPLTPKTNEIVADKIRHQSKDDAKNFFENMLKKSFNEFYRVLKPNGIAIIVYAHKTTSGWETIINALLESGLCVTSSWPISTEMKGRLLAKDSAALASSVYIIARKIKKIETGFYQDIKKDLQRYIDKKLNRLWEEGISGADFFVSAIGIGIEIFGKYKRIIDFEGNEIKADKIMEDIRSLVTEFALRQILHNGFSKQISPLTRFYILWRWNYKEGKIEFDEARKLA